MLLFTVLVTIASAVRYKDCGTEGIQLGTVEGTIYISEMTLTL